MLNDVRFGIGIFKTDLIYIYLNYLFNMEYHIKGVTTACEMCGKYAKTKSEEKKNFIENGIYIYCFFHFKGGATLQLS